MSIIEIENLKFTYPSGKQVLKGVNLTIEKGEMIGLIGDSGCGKSTLCHVMCGIIPNAIGGTASGQVRIKDKNMRQTKLKDMAETVGFVVQDSDRMIVSSTVEDELAFGPENLKIPPEEIRKRVDDTLELLQMTEYALTNPNHLSGGQKQMVTIGSVLTLHPDILILDEPHSHLDEESRIRTKALLNKLKAEGKTIIIVEHDHELIEDADRWVLLCDGKVVLAAILAMKPKYLILDEPTANLDFKNRKKLGEYLKKLDCGIIIISHDKTFVKEYCEHVVNMEACHTNWPIW